MRPLFFDYPKDDQAFNNIEQTFMLGDAIKVSPVLDQGKKEGDQFKSYFPEGIWYDLNSSDAMNMTKGEFVDLTASFARTNIHLKGGRIIPF